MAGKLVIIGVLYLSSVAFAGVSDVRNDESNKGKEPEVKPANIVRDYVCLRNGELCHPNHARNRGLYVSCSNGVAWEQQCPKCTYHPLNCPTRTLWFDGEKCEWASPKLASQPCLDIFPEYNNTEREVLSEQEELLQSLAMPQLQAVPMKESADKNQWQMNPMSVSVPMYYNKSPKYEEIVREPSQKIEAPNTGESKEIKAVEEENTSAVDKNEDDSREEDNSNQVESRKSSGEESEPEYPSYLSADDNLVASKIVKLSDPVYALVNNPDGSGKQVLMKISQPFILEDSARSGFALPSLNIISSFAAKE